MTRYFAEIDRFASQYKLTFADRLNLQLNYPLRQMHLCADHGPPPLNRIAAFITGLCDHRIRHQVQVNGVTSTIEVSFECSDFASYREIFFDGVYSLPCDIDSVHTLVDLGANTGMASLFFSIMCPNLQELLLVEANPRLLSKIKHNLQEQAQRKSIYIENLCISNDPSPETTFYVSDYHRTSLKDRPTTSYPGRAAAITVPNSRLSDLLDRQGIKSVDLLKMDIEGSEFDVLEDNDVLSRFRTLVIEVHGTLERRQHFAKRLTEMGFQIRNAVRPADAFTELLYAIR